MPADPIYNLPSLVADTARQLLSDNVGVIVAMVVAVLVVSLVMGFLKRMGGGGG
jgi:undecaprenyl pyrophosphate phosphatase UppP